MASGFALGSSSEPLYLIEGKVRFSGLDAATIIQVHKFEDIKWDTWSLVQLGSYTNNIKKPPKNEINKKPTNKNQINKQKEVLA